jgi:arylsulfatase A-like enzyme
VQRFPRPAATAAGGAVVAALLVTGLLLLDAGGSPHVGCRIPDPGIEATPAPGPQPPNIVVIVTDDQRWDTLGAMPNVRSLLGGHGVTFTNAFATTPLCCPSRASILTGRYARHTGVHDNLGPRGGAQAFDDASSIATWLDAAGYDTALVGKYLNGYRGLGRCYIPPGWDEWNAIFEGPSQHYYDLTLAVNGRLVRYGRDPGDHQTEVLFDRAERFIEGAGSPFFLYLAPSAPHLPAVPTAPDVGSFADLPPWRPASYGEPDRADKPWDAVTDRLTDAYADQIDEDRQHMLESLRSVDRAIGRLVATLESEGELDRTFLVFTSDNGFLWGEHGLVSKAWAYEESIRVPLVIRTPWTTEPRLDDQLVLNVDLASTLVELAGARAGLPQDGRSLVPLLRGEPGREWRRDFVVEWLGRDLTSTRRGPPPYSALRSERFLYVEYTNGWVELYDLAKDPFQLENLAADPRRGRRVERLHDRLAELIAA